VAAKILICDNEDALRELVCATLAPAGYETVEARDGDQSLELARSEQPDLIVLDMMMPGRTGVEVLRELRADPRFSATPVVMLTARTQVRDREAAEAAGADRFVGKPFSPLELGAVVDSLLKDRA
jgi:two-component system phosphate regulon response regulator PhoB